MPATSRKRSNNRGRRKAMGAARLRALGEELQKRKEELTTSMWGRAVGTITRRRRRAACALCESKPRADALG
jgi:hypothetical protein